MEKKPSNIGISKSLLKSLNRVYVPEFTRDENKIDELMSNFLSGELETINEILDSNKILNFKDSNGNTLVHAIIRNESSNITEEHKLQIIKKLNHKNVSLNSMTHLNQNPLHLACQKGYSDIIKYLIDNYCNQKLIDNDGNAPIHYLIDKFIDLCKDDELYNPSNRQIKLINSNKMKNLHEIIKKENFLTFIEFFKPIKIEDKSYTIFPNGDLIYKTFNKLIEYSTKRLISNIYEIIIGKRREIDKIHTNINMSIAEKKQKAKNIILNSKFDLSELYKFDIPESIAENFIENQ